MSSPKGRAHVLSNSRIRRLMSKSKYAAKTDWHALSLQQLTGPEFIRVVNLILADEYSLLPDLFQPESDVRLGVSSLDEQQPVGAVDTVWSMSQDALAVEFAYC